MERVYPELDRSRLEIKPLAERSHDLFLDRLLPLTPTPEVHPSLTAVAARIKAAREREASVVLMMGAHVLRSGVQRYLIDLMERGLVTCLAMNGAGMIHDYELALIGATTESVARYIADGSFGMWAETGRLNTIAVAAAREGRGLGEAVGRTIAGENLPHADISVLAAAWRLGVPATVHVHLGCDIVHQHPNCDGAAIGAATYRDFLRYAAQMERLQGGVVMNLGSAVMGPEVYLKALSMARNLARQEGRAINDFTTLVCDLMPLSGDLSLEAAKDNPAYYFRPYKTMLVRTVAGSGESHYVRAPHAVSLPQLWTALAA
jgi:hypothetical protein